MSEPEKLSVRLRVQKLEVVPFETVKEPLQQPLEEQQPVVAKLTCGDSILKIHPESKCMYHNIDDFYLNLLIFYLHLTAAYKKF